MDPKCIIAYKKGVSLRYSEVKDIKGLLDVLDGLYRDAVVHATEHITRLKQARDDLGAIGAQHGMHPGGLDDLARFCGEFNELVAEVGVHHKHRLTGKLAAVRISGEHVFAFGQFADRARGAIAHQHRCLFGEAVQRASLTPAKLLFELGFELASLIEREIFAVTCVGGELPASGPHGASCTAKHVGDARGGIEKIDTTTSGGRLMLNILTSVAQWEREVISERISSAMQHMKREGKRTGYIPFGMKLSEDGVHLIDDREEQEVLELIRMKREEKMSLRQLARWLNARDVTNRGRPWNAMTVRSKLC